MPPFRSWLTESSGGVVFVIGRSRRLYVGSVVRSFTAPRGGVPVVTAVLGPPYYRVVSDGGALRAVGVSEAALRAACGLSTGSVVLKEAKTPFHRTSVHHPNVHSALRALGPSVAAWPGIDLSVEPLVERAVPFAELVDPAAVRGLVIAERTRNGARTVKLALYDFDDRSVLGFFMMTGTPGDDFYEVNNAYAVDGYGPDVYDLALMHAHPKAVKPDIVIRPSALAVWRYYVARRPDVHKSQLPPSSVSYASAYAENEEDLLTLRDPSVLSVVNTKFRMPRNGDYSSLVAAGRALCSEYGVSPAAVLDAAERQFKQVYAH